MTPALDDAADPSAWTGTPAADWSVADNWTNGVPAAGTIALLDGSGTYDVTIAANATEAADSVIITDPNATLTVAGTLDTTDGITLNAGTLLALSSGAGINLGGPLINVGGVVLVVGASPFTLASGSVLQGGAISWLDTLDGTADVRVPLGAVVAATGVIEDATYLQPQATPLPVTLTNFGTILAADGALAFTNTALNNDGLITTSGSAGGVVIEGTTFDNAAGARLAATDAAGLQIDAATWTNAGLISDSGGALGLFGATWTNTGSIIADAAAALTLGGDESLAQYGQIQLSGTTSVTLSGTLENAGGTLNAATALLQGLNLSAGTIVGGVLDAAALGLSEGPAYSNLDNVLDGVTVINGLTIGAGALTLTDGSRVTADSAATTPATIDVQAGGTLVFSDTVPTVINQAITEDGGVVVLSGPFTLNSVIAGSGGTIGLDGGSGGTGTWVNQGAVLLSGGTLDLDGDETVAQIGSIGGAGNTIIYTGGTLNNAGGTLDATTTNLLGLQLAGGAIAGGTLDAASLGLGFAFASTGNDLAGVTLINGLTISSGSVTLTDGSVVTADAAAAVPTAILVTGSGLLSFAPDALSPDAPYIVAQSVTADAGTVSLDGAFTYTGSLAASNATVVLGGGVLGGGVLGGGVAGGGTTAASWTNRGEIALTSGTLELDGNETLAQLGSLTDAGAQVLYNGGTLDNTGATLDADATPLLGMGLTGGTIEGGVLDATALGLAFASADQIGPIRFGDLDNVAIINNFTAAGLVSLSGDTAVYADASQTMSGVLTASGSGAIIVFIGDAPATLINDISLDGGELSWAASENVTVGTVDVTIAAGVAISGTGTFAGPLNGSVVDLTNDGTIDADSAGGSLILDAATLTNDGLLVVSAGAVLTIGSDQLLYDLITGQLLPGTAALRNNGTIVLDGGTLVLNTDASVADLGVIINNSGTILYAGGTLDNTAGTLGAASTAGTLGGASTGLLGLQLAGGTIAGGTLDPTALGLAVLPGYQDGYSVSDLDNVSVINNATINGALAFSGTTAVYADATATTLGSIAVSGFGAALLFLGAGPASLDNPVVLTGGSLSWAASLTTISPTVTATIAAGVVVAGSGDLGQDAYQTPVDLINQGTISADQQAGTLAVAADTLSNEGLMTVTAGAILALGTVTNDDAAGDDEAGTGQATSPSFVNTGSIVLDGGATLELSVDASVAQLGSIVDDGGTIILAAGTLDNTGGTLDAAARSLIGLQLGGGTIEGGTLDVAALGLIGGGGFATSDLDNVTVIGGLALSAPLSLSGTTAVYADAGLQTPGSIALAGYYAGLLFTGAGPFTLDNPVSLSGGTLGWTVNNGGSTVAVTIASAGSVSGYGDLGPSSGQTSLSLRNLGTIAATTPGQDLYVNVATLVNAAVLSVSADAVLTLGTVSLQFDPTPQTEIAAGSSLVNTGTIALNGGTLFLNADATVAQLGQIANNGGTVFYTGGTLDNTGGTLDAASTALLGLQLDGGTIAGGAVDAAALGVAIGGPFNAASDLDDVAVFGTLFVGALLNLTGTTQVYADASRSAPGAIVVSGDGQAVFVGSGLFTLDNPVFLAGGVLTWASAGTAAVAAIIAADDTVAGYGTLGSTPQTPVDLTNLGTIAADQPGQSLAITASTLTNQALLTVGTGDILTLGSAGTTLNPVTGSYQPVASALFNDGTVALNGGSLALDVDATVAQIGSIANAGGTVFYQGGTLDNTGGTLGAATVSLRGLQLGGGTLQGGTIDIAALGFAVSGLSDAGFGDLDNVTLIGSLAVSAPVYLTGSTTVYADASQSTPGMITVGAAAGDNSPEIVFVGAGPFTLDNNVTLAGGAVSWAGSQIYTYSTIPIAATIAAAAQVSGIGNIGGQFNGALVDLTNLGTINADVDYTTTFQDLLVEASGFTNQGTLIAQDGGGLVLSYTTLTNIADGTLTGGSYVSDSNSQIEFGAPVLIDAADIVLSGVNAYDDATATLTDIAAGGTLEVDLGASVAINNALTVDGALLLGGATLSAPAITVDATGAIVGFGSLSATDGWQSAGLIQAQGGTLTLSGTVEDAATIDVAATAALQLNGADNAVVHLQGHGAALLLDNGGSLFDGVVQNFATGDAIVLQGFAGAAAHFSHGTLSVSNSVGTVTLRLAGSFAANAFTTTLPSADETIITLGQPQTLTAAAPTSLFDNPGSVLSVAGVSVQDFNGATITVDINALHGVLAAVAPSGGGEQGNGTNSLILSGDLAAVNAGLASLQYRAPGVGTPGDTIAVEAADSAGSTDSALITVDINQPPTLTVSDAVLAQPGAASAAAGFAVTDPDAVAGETYTVTVSDTAGALSVSPATSAVVIGNFSPTLTITGALGAVNNELAGLTFTGAADDDIEINADDGRGGLGAAFAPVYVNQPPQLTAPAIVQGFFGTAAAVSGIGVTDPYGSASADRFTVDLNAAAGTLTAAAFAGGTVNGSGSGSLIIAGSLAAVDQELASLAYTGPAAGFSTGSIDIAVNDGHGGSASFSIAVAPPAPPVLSLPSVFVVGAGLESPLDGVGVAPGAGLAAGTPISLDIQDSVGTLAVKINNGVTVGGNGTTELTLTGDAADLNTALSSLIYTGGSSLDTQVSLDTLDITATADGVTASGSVAVHLPINNDNAAQPQSLAVLILHSGLPAVLQYDNDDSAYVGTLYVNLPYSYAGEPPGPGLIGLQVLNDNIVSATDAATVVQEPDAPVVGDWQTTGPFSASGIAGFFATGSLITATDAAPTQPDQITYIFKSTASDAGQLPDRRLTIVFNDPNAVATTMPTSDSGTSDAAGSNVVDAGTGSAYGDVHLTTFDGLYYDFQAADEFVLARSKQAGDTFEVQIRLQPWASSESVSVITAAGVAIGEHTVTFDINRSATVWVDGIAQRLTTGEAPSDLGAGTLQQLTASSWQILYDSGETVTVINEGGFLDVQATVPRSMQGQVDGLLGTDTGITANDLALPNGTILPQPLSAAGLYTTFANAWRINQANSLLDYGAGQITATFTDLNFPSGSISLANLPLSIVQNADSLIAAAGITDPAAAHSALEDYLATGDAAFITADAGAALPVAAVLASPTLAAVDSLGIAALHPAATLAAGGSTDIGFTIYETAFAGGAQTVGYTLAASGGLTLGIPASGTVTIAAGQMLTSLEVQVLGSLTVPSAALTALISSVGGATPILAATATVELDNPEPVAGAAALPVFIDVGNVGSFSAAANGTVYTLNLGTITQDTNFAPVLIDIANQAGGAADSLFGNLTGSGNGIAFGSFLRPIAGLPGGGIAGLTGSLDTSRLGFINQTISFDANERNPSGFTADLGTMTLDITATIIPCFAAGTRIRTSLGQVRVQDLRIGSTVLTADGTPRPIVWLGARQLDCRRHPDPAQIWPIEVAAHAFGRGQPSRRLRLSPDHAVYADGVLVPIKTLINGITIVQRRVRSVAYFHVELDCHDILLAEGLPAESYLDTGDRAHFSGGAAITLHPDFATRNWEARGCAPLFIVGPQVAALRRRLAERAIMSPAERATSTAA